MKINEIYTDHEGFGFYNGGDHLSMDQQFIQGSLYNWMFHYNEYTSLWNAVHRDKYNDYWSDPSISGVISSRSISTLIEIIKKTDGDKNKLEKLISE